MDRVRIDKWLWAARFFKTRSLAEREPASSAGSSPTKYDAKPARDVRIGDLLRIKNDGGEFQVEVLALSEMRGPAPVAQKLYRETDASREMRMKLAEERKAMPHFEAAREGKPSKRDRREIGRLRGRDVSLSSITIRHRALASRSKTAPCCCAVSRLPKRPLLVEAVIRIAQQSRRSATWSRPAVTPCPWR